MKLYSLFYAILKFVEWNLENEPMNNSDISKFSTNNLTSRKLKLLPYFLCTANGNRQAMFEIFDSFYAAPDGYIEGDLESLLDTGKDIFQVFTINDSGLQIKNVDLLSKLFKKEQNKLSLSDEEFLKAYGEDFTKEFTPGVIIQRIENVLYHISHSIESLKKQDHYYGGGILDLPDFKLSVLSKLHFIYKMHINNEAKHEEYEVDGQPRKKIKTSYLVLEKSIFGEKPENRIHTPIFELIQEKTNEYSNSV